MHAATQQVQLRPAQEAMGLQHLQELTLVGCHPDPEQYAPLALLSSSLTSLNLTSLDCVPDCLSELTALRRLSELPAAMAVADT